MLPLLSRTRCRTELAWVSDPDLYVNVWATRIRKRCTLLPSLSIVFSSTSRFAHNFQKQLYNSEQHNTGLYGLLKTESLSLHAVTNSDMLLCRRGTHTSILIHVKFSLTTWLQRIDAIWSKTNYFILLNFIIIIYGTSTTRVIHVCLVTFYVLVF